MTHTIKVTEITYSHPIELPYNQLLATLPDGRRIYVCTQYGTITSSEFYTGTPHKPTCPVATQPDSAWPTCNCNHEGRVRQRITRAIKGYGLTSQMIVDDARLRGWAMVETAKEPTPYDADEIVINEHRSESDALAEQDRNNSSHPGYCTKCHTYCYGDCEAN